MPCSMCPGRILDDLVGGAVRKAEERRAKVLTGSYLYVALVAAERTWHWWHTAFDLEG